ncbi:MAG TPA: hypothetical protein VF432_24570 [Thermoanaerobaculia bacterium]
MSRQRLIFQWGWGISLVLLLASIASGANDFGRSFATGDIRYREMPHVATWATTLYLGLNLPAVVTGVLLVTLIRRVFGLSVPVAVVLLPPICVYLSCFWWRWLSRRLAPPSRNVESPP